MATLALMMFGTQEAYLYTRIWHFYGMLKTQVKVRGGYLLTLNLVQAHTLDILDVMKPYPSYIIIGTGKDQVNIPEDVYKRF